MTRTNIPFPGPFPLSTAIIYTQGQQMEISGQIGMNPKTKQLEEGIQGQTRQCLEILKQILEDNGWQLSDIVKTRIYLINMKDYAAMNEVYSEYFSQDYPTRVAMAVKELPAGALVEIECSAARN